MLLGVVALRAGTKIHYDGAEDARHELARGQRSAQARVSSGLVAVGLPGLAYESARGLSTLPGTDLDAAGLRDLARRRRRG